MYTNGNHRRVHEDYDDDYGDDSDNTLLMKIYKVRDETRVKSMECLKRYRAFIKLSASKSNAGHVKMLHKDIFKILGTTVKKRMAFFRWVTLNNLFYFLRFNAFWRFGNNFLFLKKSKLGFFKERLEGLRIPNKYFSENVGFFTEDEYIPARKRAKLQEIGSSDKKKRVRE
jgi:hypothetical protein